MKRLIRAVLALSLLAGIAGWVQDTPLVIAQSGTTTAVRLAVVDFATNAVTVVNGEDGATLGSFSMPGPGSVYGSSGGRWFYVVHTAAGRVSVIDSGLRLEDHGDHQDLEVGPVFVRGTTVTGRRPIDTWVQNGMLTVHNDDDGTLALFEDRRLEVALDYTEIRGAGTGHNNGLVLGDFVLLSHASTGRVTVYRMDGSAVETFAGCPGTHGWTLTGATAAAGCGDGVMLFSLSGGRVTMTKLSNPATTSDGVRVGTLRSNPRAPLLVGNWGAGLILIDLAARTMTPVSLPAAPLAFYFTADGSRLIVLTPDGMVHALNPATGAVLGAVAAVAPYTTPGQSDPPAPRPNMVVGNGVAYLTNPTRGEIVEVNTTSVTVSRRMPVGGTPQSIGIVSMTGVLD